MMFATSYGDSSMSTIKSLTYRRQAEYSLFWFVGQKCWHEGSDSIKGFLTYRDAMKIMENIKTNDFLTFCH